MADQDLPPLDRLPHREPFRFVSKIEAIEPGRWARGQWKLSGKEDFFAGHFPDDPIVPGVLLGEALAQLSGLVLFHESHSGMDARLAHIDVKFAHAVRPPALIELESTLTRTIGDLSLFGVRASNAGTEVARGSLTLKQIIHEDSP